MRFRLCLLTALSVLLLFALSSRAQAVDPAVAPAEAAFAAKRYTDAIPLYRRVVASTLPASVRANAQWRIGDAYLQSQNLPAARAAWLALADRFPGQPGISCKALLRVANLALEQNDYIGAQFMYNRAVYSYGNAPDAAEFAVEALSRLGSTYLHMAEQEKKKGVRKTGNDISDSSAAARRAFERVVLLFPKENDWVANAKLQLMALKMESSLYGRARYSAAEVLANEFLAEYPNDAKRAPTVRYLKAKSLYQQNRLDEAISEIRLLQKDFPDGGQPYVSSQFLLGECYGGMRDYDNAIAAYRKFLTTVAAGFSGWQERPLAQLSIGLCLIGLGRKDEGIDELLKVRAQYGNSYVADMADSDAEAWKASSANRRRGGAAQSRRPDRSAQ